MGRRLRAAPQLPR
jgi:hypothetical protein